MSQISTSIARMGLMTALPAVLGMAVLPPAWAQQAVTNGGLEEVVVTAQKRTQNLQKTSLAVTAVTGERINEQGLTDAAAVLSDVPNVVVQGAARGQVIAIRGLGSDLPPGVGESAVSTNFDGVYNYRAESSTVGFYDLARVEVLRGPQSTLYGRNATGGVVNTISANPNTDKLSGYTTGEIGNYNLKRVETVLNVPLSDKWAARIAYANIDRKGFSNNGGNDAVGWGARAKALYKDGDNLSVLLGYEENHLKGKGNSGTSAANWDAGKYFTNSYSSNISQDYVGKKYFAEVNAKVGPGSLTFIPSYQHGEGYVCGDMGMSVSPTGVDCGWDPKRSVQKAVDLRYAALPESSIQWITGLYYYNLSNAVDGVNGKSKDTTNALALYGQATFPISEGLRGIAGIRTGKDKKGYENKDLEPKVNSREFTSFDYKLGLEYDVAKDSLAYATLASGHRPGGFNSFPGAGSSFEPEKLVSLEIGSKNRFMGGKVQLNGDVFYYDYKDFQASDFFFPAGSSFPSLFIYNVAKVKNYGLELEGKARVADNTMISGSITALSSKYGSSFFLHDGPTALDMNGQTLPHAPKLTIKAGIEQGFDFASGSSLTAKVDVRRTSEQYVAPFPGATQTQKAYVQADASLMYRPADDSWSLNFYGRNLTNKVTKIAYFAGEFIAGTPRQYGVTLNVKY